MTINLQLLIKSGIISLKSYKNGGWLLMYYAITGQSETLRLGYIRRNFSGVDDDLKGTARAKSKSKRRTLLIVPLPAEFENKETIMNEASAINNEQQGHIHREEERTLMADKKAYLKVFLKYDANGKASFVYRFCFYTADGYICGEYDEQMPQDVTGQFIDMAKALELVPEKVNS